MTESLLGSVLGSTVRTDVLVTLAAEARQTRQLVESVDASESAVYNALDDLKRKGLVRAVDGRCEVTGSGQVLSDYLERQDDLCRLLEEEYWENHDVSALPARFRLRLPDLADATVFRASDTEPHAVVREVCHRIESSGTDVRIVSPVYQPEYEDVMPDAPEARLLLGETMLTERLDKLDPERSAREFERTTVRVLDTDVALGVTDGHLMLSLPTLDGQYDSRTEVFGTSEAALAWGRDLFDHYWRDGVAASEFLAGLDT